MSVNDSVRLLVALQRVESLVLDGIAPAYACSQIAKKIGVDGAELALLWQRKDQACARARGALQRPDGYDTTTKTRATTAEASDG